MLDSHGAVTPKGLMYGVENRFKMQLLLGLKRAHCEMGIQQIRTTPGKQIADFIDTVKQSSGGPWVTGSSRYDGHQN